MMDTKKPVVAISGGFDPPHAGHIDYIEAAGNYGDVHIYLNSDEWLMRKKGYVFMPLAQRARVLWAMKGVKMVIPAHDEDGTVNKTIQQFKPQFFAKGGEKGPDNTPEAELCGHLGIEVIYGVGGDRTESSSALLNRFAEWVKEDGYVEPVPVQGEWGK